MQQQKYCPNIAAVRTADADRTIVDRIAVRIAAAAAI